MESCSGAENKWVTDVDTPTPWPHSSEPAQSRAGVRPQNFCLLPLGFCPPPALSEPGFFRKEIQPKLSVAQPWTPPPPSHFHKKPSLPGQERERENFSKGCMRVLLGAASVLVNSRSQHSLTNGRKFRTWA